MATLFVTGVSTPSNPSSLSGSPSKTGFAVLDKRLAGHLVWKRVYHPVAFRRMGTATICLGAWGALPVSCAGPCRIPLGVTPTWFRRKILIIEQPRLRWAIPRVSPFRVLHAPCQSDVGARLVRRLTTGGYQCHPAIVSSPYAQRAPHVRGETRRKSLESKPLAVELSELPMRIAKCRVLGALLRCF